jgi:hypothetical protein
MDPSISGMSGLGLLLHRAGRGEDVLEGLQGEDQGIMEGLKGSNKSPPIPGLCCAAALSMGPLDHMNNPCTKE